jgi:hypothetical protein
MAEFKLGRIRFVWKNTWTTGTVYYKDDVVRYGGKTYICQVGHTANASFDVDLTFSPTKWNVMSAGQEWREDWTTGTVYKIGDLVKYGAAVYTCNTGHTSSATNALGLEADQSKWDLFAEGFDWKEEWSVNFRYKKYDIVKYGGYTYVANAGHTSAATVELGLEADQSKWDEFNQGIEYKTDWITATRYKVNDVVKYGAGLWICVNDHSATDFISDESNWEAFTNGFQFEEQWNVGTTYQPGDVVRYGGNQYVAKTNHVGSVPVDATTDWSLFSEGFNWANDWVETQDYRIGDVVRVNGNTYLAIVDAPSTEVTVSATNAGTGIFTSNITTNLVAGMVVKFTGTTFGNVATSATYYIQDVLSATEFTVDSDQDGTAFTPTTASGLMTATVAPHPTNTSYYQPLNSGISWQNEWSDDTEYEIGDAVRYDTNSYICIKKHRSEQDDGSTIGATGGGASNSRPDLDITGTYWNVISIGSETQLLTFGGDLIYYGGSGPARLPIGLEGQVLRVSADEYPEWTTLGENDFVYFVSTDRGVDLPAPAHGVSLDKPFKTIRYACEQVLNGPRYPQARTLVEINRAFIQHEVTAWIRYQILNAPSGGIWENFVYDDLEFERDVGLIIDRMIWDVGHGGNLKMRAAAQAFLNVSDDGPFSVADEDTGIGFYDNLPAQGEQGAAAYNYMLEVIEAVLLQEDPATIYQNVTDDSTAIVVRNIDTYIFQGEVGALEEMQESIGIITTVLLSNDEDDIPRRVVPNNLINVATGQYRETLPIIVPASTCILGDELRSTNAGPAGSSRNPEDAFYTIKTLDRVDFTLRSLVVGTVVASVSPDPLAPPQKVQVPFADAAEATLVSDLVQMIKNQIDYNLGTMYTSTLTDPTGYNVGYLTGYGDARKLVQYNKKFLQEEVIAYLVANYPDLRYSKTDTRRDTGYLVDAIIYDLTYGGNAMSVKAGLAYWGGDDNTDPQIPASIKAATLAAITFLKGRMQSVAVNGTISTPLQTVVPQFRGTAGSAGASTFIGTNMNVIIEIVDNGPDNAVYTLTDPAATDGVTSTTALIAAYAALDAAATTIRSDTITYINTTYPDLVYNSAKCSRDVGIILKAVGYDFMFNSNYQSIKAAHAYLRESASEVYTLNQKTVTRAALEYVRTQAVANVAGDADAIARINILMRLIDSIIFGASNEGSVNPTLERNRDYAALLLEFNEPFVLGQIPPWVDAEFSDTVTTTDTVDDSVTITDTSWLTQNAPIIFDGVVFGGIVGGRTYYVREILSPSKFAISQTRYGPVLNLTSSSGSMTVKLAYNSDTYVSDVSSYIDAIKYDIKYPGNYKSRYSARYITNAVIGSLEEDMFYLRDATGVRDMTLTGLSGDLTPPNAFGTSRVTAGAYVSLDPGWGPDDFTTWIIDRSPYVQGVTTFGTAAVGQKIDGALHAGGNDSIVSNDFTQVISDGIGAWVANNGRAELVSVFSYYAHIGYLSTDGGRIRGTNGNNSYGGFGAVAEGVDGTEIPNTAIVDNIFKFTAELYSITTDGSALQRAQFLNAGIDYTELVWGLTGGGVNGEAVQDEFRDNGVYQIRLLEGSLESEQFGGLGYITAANTAQVGTTTSITLAATDDNPDTRYIGMTIILTGGAAVGQTAIIDTYNAATKVAEVVKISDGTAGWDHIVPGTAIVSPDASTTYQIEPTVEFTAPPFSATSTTVTSATWTDVVFGQASAVYTGVTGTYSGSGTPTDATFEVIRNGWKYFVTGLTAGAGYERLETITIAGTDLGGTSPANDIIITITSVDPLTGGLVLLDGDGFPAVPFDFVGNGFSGRYVALKNSSATGEYSNDGLTWTSMNMPSSQNWSAVATALVDDGSSTGKLSAFVAVSSGSSVAAYSEDGITWTATALPVSAAWNSVAYGEGRWVAVASDSTTVAISLDGQTWDLQGTLPTTGYSSVVYGKGLFVAVRSGTAVAASSVDGATWVARTLPATSAWNSVAWGNNRFVAVATNSNSGAYSLNGTTWTAMSMGSLDGSSVAGYQKVRYGQGVFMASAHVSGVEGYSYVATSEDGLLWTARGLPQVGDVPGYNALAFGTPQRTGYWVVLPFGSSTHAVRVKTGARAKGRVNVADGKIFETLIIEPGSGYEVVPTVTFTDPGVIYDVVHEVRIGSGVLANPTFVNRGSSYVTGSANLSDGDGYADNYQASGVIAVRRVTQRPVAGSNVVFSHLPTRVFKLVNVLTFLGEIDGSYTAFYQVSPPLTIAEAPDHNTSLETRIRYSQVRLTGHDFLDIGTGGFATSNYPGIPLIAPDPSHETKEGGGGRVFFTSTDQNGNFRVGDLFAVEQSTGIATLNADAFNISGLNELNLGNVTLGGGSATITEFSTDPFFSADSDNIVPTQRAIKAYIASQIGGGGASLNVNSVTAGSILINSNQITTITGGSIQMNATFDFRGGIIGQPLALNFFLI